MSLTRTNKRASIKGSTPKTEEVKLENAYVLPAELGDRIRLAFGEIPRKYNALIAPLEQALAQAYRGTITMQVARTNNLPLESQVVKEELSKETDEDEKE